MHASNLVVPPLRANCLSSSRARRPVAVRRWLNPKRIACANLRLVKMHSREQLMHVLAEAAELEHNILCCYLYAAFSLKTSSDEGLTASELAHVSAWRKELMGICVEEMTHLSQVANLTIAIGVRPHFNRPNFPVAKGYHPAAVELALAPFDLDTLDHFIFLERPEGSDERDAPPVGAAAGPPRDTLPQVLMPAAPDYETIGEFYELLKSGLRAVSEALGERRLFCGSPDHQLSAQELRSEDLLVVHDLDTAIAAIDTIIVQGEGSQAERDGSHYRRLAEMKSQYQALQAARSDFCPHRNVAHNPVMRAPVAEDRVHIASQPARTLLDAANGTYAAMMSTFTALYDLPRDAPARPLLLSAALSLMHMVAAISDALTRLPASDAPGAPNAGVTFTVLRSTEGFSVGADAPTMVGERLALVEQALLGIVEHCPLLGQPLSEFQAATAGLRHNSQDSRAKSGVALRTAS